MVRRHVNIGVFCTYISCWFVVPVHVDAWLRRCRSFRTHVEMGAAFTRILSAHWRHSIATVSEDTVCRHSRVILDRVTNKLTRLEVDSTKTSSFQTPTPNRIKGDTNKSARRYCSKCNVGRSADRKRTVIRRDGFVVSWFRGVVCVAGVAGEKQTSVAFHYRSR